MAKTKKTLHARLTSFLGFEVSRQQVREWQQAGFSVEDFESLRRELELSAKSDVGKPAALKEQLLNEQILKCRADRMIKETSLEKIRGELVDRHEVERDMEALGAMLASELLQLKDILPPMLDGMAATAMRPKIDSHVRKVISGFRRSMEKRLPRKP